MNRHIHLYPVLLLLVLFLGGGSLWSQGPAWPCDGSFFISGHNRSGASLMYRVQVDPATNQAVFEAIELSDSLVFPTTLGYSVRDGYLYSLDFHTYELLRIDAAGTVERLGVPENLDTSLLYYGGEVTADGRSLRVIGHDPVTGADNRFYSIRLFESGHYAGIGSLISNRPVAISDLARDPIQGVTYGFDAQRKQLVVVGGGNISTYAYSGISPTMGSLFFSRDGRLYGYGSRSALAVHEDLFEINQFTGTAQLLRDGPSARISDGCSCPYSIRFQRTVIPGEAPPCGEVLIRYDILNHSGQGRLGLTLRDELPPGFEILEVVQNSSDLGDIQSAEGTNLFEMTGMDIVLGDNVIVLRVRVAGEPGSEIETQASLDNLPVVFGDPLLSDDPARTGARNPNLLRIIHPDSIELEDYVRYSCDRDTAFLGLPFAFDEYLWSDGSTGPALPATADGTYWLQASNACWSFADTIVVGNRPPALALDLGPDREIAIGESLPLTYATTADSVAAWQWTAAGDTPLSCYLCPAPSLLVRADETIQLTIRDADGCTLTDELRIRALPERRVFFPNAFSPDGDGINDTFFPQAGINAVVRELVVYDRWGSQVFLRRDGALNDPAQGWDGRVKGEPAPAGPYLFSVLIEFADGGKEVFSGEVLLLR